MAPLQRFPEAGCVMATEDQKQRFAAALAEEREAAGLTFAVLGKAVGRTGSAVQQWESGQTEPDPDTAFKLEKFLELPAGRLSTHLGYVRANVGGPADVIAILQRDERLDDRGRENLIALYRREVANARAGSSDELALAASSSRGVVADAVERARDVVEEVLDQDTRGRRK